MRNLRLILERREKSILQSLDVQRPLSAYGAADHVAALGDARVDENREDLDEALHLLQQRRRESRVASFQAALDHGLSVDELSRVWRVSRELASRYINEARRE